MLCFAQAGTKPAKVVLTSLPDGSVMAALHDNIKKVELVSEFTSEDGEAITSTGYTYDEVMFPLPYDRVDEETVKTITASFADWWTYGVEYTGENNTPSLEDRVTDLENSLMALMSL